MSGSASVLNSGLILFAGWLIGGAVLTVSYWLADYIWIQRHSLHFSIGARPARCSGAIGEWLLLGFAALTLFVVDAFTPSASLGEILSGHWRVWLIATVIVGGLVTFYSIATALKAPNEGQPADFRRRLTRTYAIYSAYSTLIFTGGIILIFTLVSQFIADTAVFHAAAREVLATAVADASQPAGELMRRVEISFIDGLDALNSAEDQMAPVFMFAAGLFTINLVVLFTPLRGLFLNNAVFITNLSTIVALVSVTAVGAAIYLGTYTQFIDAYLAALDRFKPILAEQDWTLMKRFAEVRFIIDDKRSLLGFITEMSNEWGGVAAALGAVQWAVSQLAKPAHKASPVEEGAVS